MKLLSSKIFSGYLLVIVSLTAIIVLFSYQKIKTHYKDTLTTQLINLNNTIHEPLLEYLNHQDIGGLDEYVKKLGKRIHTRITVIDTNGVVLADSEKNPKLMENHKGRPEIKKALVQDFGSTLRYSTTVNERMLYVAHPIISNHHIIGISRVSLYADEIDTLIIEILYEILEVVVIFVLITLFAVLFFTRSITKPLQKISMAAQKVASGDFDVKVFLHGKSEIKDLSDNFNFMTQKIKELFSKVTSQKEELDAIISSINEGLAVFDTKGKILLSNKAFCNMLDCSSCSDAFYWEAIDSENFGELFRDVVDKKKTIQKDLEISDKFYAISASFIESKNEIVFLLRDITKAKELELLKKDFVTNVSHELRTPLTAIKGFVETLEDEVQEDTSMRYVDIIKRHTDRLINIVQDLMMLSELENVNKTLMKSQVNIRNLISNVSKIFDPKLQEKKLEYNVNIEENFPDLIIDNFKIEQVFVNLIDNAIKYTEEGKIEINIFNKEKNAIIEISDTGVGIPDEDKDRVFERFYRVDKSRSRKVGGTGLGLSIVKHIVQLHGGKIYVDYDYKIGSKIVISLPIIQ